MKALNKHPRKVFMWYKVRELFSDGLNKSQIGKEVGIHRKTVRQYLNKSEEEFHSWIEQTKNRPKKLNIYYSHVKQLLERYPYLSSAQVEDRLKEQFSDFPSVHNKTVYNFVENIRRQHAIIKQTPKQPRQYEKLPEPDYGKYAQADFGEYHMLTQGSGRKKVYFFCMVLCRSRQKFVYFQSQPFTTASTIQAHEQAFRYFEGHPKKIIYDQDRVLIIDENLGDVLLTKEFTSYVGQMSFTPVFCRKSDPESKGKIENVVKYVKQNFLCGRIYIDDDELNQSAKGWLTRTANGKEHAGIKKVPSLEWKHERPYLIPIKESFAIEKPEALRRYKVRKDNTISYKSNFYTLPLGTYKNQDTWVFLKEYQGELRMYDEKNHLLTTHLLCYQRGKTIRNSDHTRDKSQSLSQLRASVMQMLPDKEKGLIYIEQIEQDKSRYLRDNLLILQKHLPEYPPAIILRVLDFCLENRIYNTYHFYEIAKHYSHEQSQQTKAKAVIPEERIKQGNDIFNITPITSKISTYESIL
jgi:transposase